MSDLPLLMIPGPVELAPDVLAASAVPATSHVGAEFRDVAAAVLTGIRDLFRAPTAQPLFIAGSGTVGLEIALANVVEPGDRALILETGVFGTRFAEIATCLGADVRVEKAPLGQAIDPDQVRRALGEFGPKVLTITHVDTSTGVRVDVPTLVRLGREHDALVIVDGVCSIGGEEYRGDEWGVDVGLTATQKAIAAPPGMALLTFSERAVETRRSRKAPFTSFFTDLLRWIPVMSGYEGGTPRYFGTPPVTLLPALKVALAALFAEGIDRRVARHARIGRAFQAGVAAIGFPNFAAPDAAASTLTAPAYPPGIGDDLPGLIRQEGVQVAGALHPDLRGRAFRVGHMGNCGPSEIFTTLAALERAARNAGARIDLGASLAAAQSALATSPTSTR